MLTLSLGFSPCPNDTFIFDALVNQKIELPNINLELVIADVAELNRLAFEGKLDVTKISYHALGHVLPKYELLKTGSALGNNCGPLLIAKRFLNEEEIKNATIAIPGQFTTANFLLSLAFPQIKHKKEMLFSEIEQAVLNNEVDAGLIIHENRFTYEEKGLLKIIDLGEFWETLTNLPIPLGGIAIKRSLASETKKTFENLLRKSIEMAFEQPQNTLNYVKKHAQEMNEKVMMQHIGLYVNQYSIDLGEKGERAIETLFDMAQKKSIIPPFNGNVLLQ
ncbi:MAG: menaquinone biosynthesis family protein [Chitinophagales bacterium]